MNLDPNQNEYITKLKDVMEDYLISFGGRNLYEDFVKRLKLTDPEEEVLKKHFFNPFDLDPSQFTETDKEHLSELIFKYYRKDKEGDLEAIKQTEKLYHPDKSYQSDDSYQMNGSTPTETDFDYNNNFCVKRLKQLVDSCMDQSYDDYLNLVDKLDLAPEEEKVLNDYFLLPDEIDLDSCDEVLLEGILESYHDFECKVIKDTKRSDYSSSELKLLKQIMFKEAEIIDFMDYLNQN